MNKVTIQIPLGIEYYHAKIAVVRTKSLLPIDPHELLDLVVVQMRETLKERFEAEEYQIEPPAIIRVEFHSIDDDLIDVELYFANEKAAIVFKLAHGGE
ncbi:hypothetical protein RMR21_015565 [Agrobacterium sp. rho-8.1]|nr:hypothetical protein [Agrobacterium sp. rho-8.1]